MDPVQLLPLLARPVERLEDVGDLELHRAAQEHPLQRGARLGVRRIGGQDLAVGLDRLAACRPAPARRSARAGRSARRDPRRSARSGSRAGRSRPARPTAGRARYSRSSATSAVLAVGIGVDGAPVGRDRLLELAGLLLVDAREAQQQIDRRGAVRRPSRSRSRAASPAWPSGRSRPPAARGARARPGCSGRRAARARRRRTPRSGATAGAPRSRRCCDSSSTVRTGVLAVRRHHLVDRDHAIPLARALVDRLEHGGRQHRLVLAVHQRLERARASARAPDRSPAPAR